MTSCCIHFNNNGDLYGSVVEGVVMVNINSRLMTLSAVNNLKVNEIIGYNVYGHGIFLETGS